MTKRAALFILVCLVAVCMETSSHAQSGAVASVKREKTPLQFTFGPWTAISPFNHLAGYTTITSDDQIFPSSLITLTNNFSSIASFTQTDYSGGGSCTFTVASNVGTVACAAGEQNIFVDTSTSFTGPRLMVRVTVEQNGTASSGTFDNAGPGIFKDGNNFVDYEWDHRNNLAVFHIRIAGVDSTTNTGCTLPSAPWTAGFSISNNNAHAWVKDASGTKFCADKIGFTAYDFTTDGNLTGWHPGFVVRLNQSSTWKFSNLQAGSAGSVGLRDIHVVTYPDGRPYTQGSKVYLTATTALPGPLSGSGWTTWSLDLSSNALTRLGTIFDERGGHTYADAAGHLIYDPGNGIYRVMIPSWANGTPVHVYYGTATVASNDLLATGSHTVSGLTQTTFGGLNSDQGWDPNLVCDQWNYSLNSCSHWLLSYDTEGANFSPAMFSSASDPSLNTWTLIASNSNFGYEGSMWIRTATTSGSSGVTYVAAYGGDSRDGIRSSAVYDKTLALLGAINIMWPAANDSSPNDNAPWPTMFAYGNKQYILTFDDAQFGTQGETMGDVVLASAPKYTSAANWPSLVGSQYNWTSSSSVASISTTTGITVSTGDLIVGACRGANTSLTSLSTADSLGNTLTNMSMNSLSGTGSGKDEGFYGFATVGGLDTFTCTPSASSTFMAVVAEVYHPGFLTSADFTGYENQNTASSITWTSGTFSTTAQGLIVACGDSLFNGGVHRAGLIGPYSPVNQEGEPSTALSCDATLSDAAQTGITASISSGGNAGGWGGIIMSFK